ERLADLPRSTDAMDGGQIGFALPGDWGRPGEAAAKGLAEASCLPLPGKPFPASSNDKASTTRRSADATNNTGEHTRNNSSPISSVAVQRMACDCSVTRILLSQESLVIDIGRSKRVISGPARKALSARDGHCRWPGCERPASWCDGHHLVHWIDGGDTDLDNLV